MKTMKTSDELASLGPNLSITLQQQVAAGEVDWSSLRMTLCETSATASDHNTIGNLDLVGSLLSSSPTLTSTIAQHHQHDYRAPLTIMLQDNLLGPMQTLDTKLDYYFSDFWTQNGDERTHKLPFMAGGPWKLLYATIVYLYLIKWLLPKVMRPLRALELTWCIRCYNLLMVLSNMYAFYHGARLLQFGLKCFGCEVINHRDTSPAALELLHYGWLFFMSRLVEWLDTIFFVLRKKERQVTKLHVFHHSFVPLMVWTYLKFHPGYTVAFFPFVNTFVHTIMYTYYLLATFGPKIQAYLWWKKYLTTLQITQFVLILVQLATIPLSTSEQCQYPRGFLLVAFAGAILFLWLFYTYYLDTYSRTASTVKATHTNGTPSKCANGSTASRIIKNQAREGSSRALSDAIDNVLDNGAWSDSTVYCNGVGGAKVHKRLGRSDCTQS